MKSECFVILLLIFLLEEHHFVCANSIKDAPQEPTNQNAETECNEYCFLIFKPVLDHFVHLKTAADANNEMRETIKDLQSQLKNGESEIKIKEEAMKVKDEQIADLRNHIKSLETTLSERSNQLLECRETEANFPDSCPSGSPNGIYQIKPRGMEPFKVPCVSSPSGWSVILRRFDGSENFDRNWTDYKNGFGNVRGEFFIGLEKLHQMTNARPHELYIKLGKVNGSKSYAQYDDFRIGNEEESYELKSVGIYSGEAGDSLKGHVNKKFSTFDRDNDLSTENCALNRGGWWYLSCYFRYTALEPRIDHNAREAVEEHDEDEAEPEEHQGSPGMTQRWQ